jgi:hypothetical protein
LSGKYQQVLIATDEQIGWTALGQIQKRLIAGISTHCWTSLCHLDHFTVRKILSQQFSSIVSGKPEFRVTENPREFRGGCMRDQRDGATFTPVLA